MGGGNTLSKARTRGKFENGCTLGKGFLGAQKKSLPAMQETPEI